MLREILPLGKARKERNREPNRSKIYKPVGISVRSPEVAFGHLCSFPAQSIGCSPVRLVRAAHHQLSWIDYCFGASTADLCVPLEIDPQEESPGRPIVRSTGVALVSAMEMALRAGNRAAAQIVAAECVVLAETKDHLDWELIGKCADKLPKAQADAVRQAYEQVEDQEDEHVYHTKGVPRVVDRKPGHEGHSAAARGREGREDRDWRGGRGAVGTEVALILGRGWRIAVVRDRGSISLAAVSCFRTTREDGKQARGDA
jgi:hypothetical protein